jgi:hypothetical protein
MSCKDLIKVSESIPVANWHPGGRRPSLGIAERPCLGQRVSVTFWLSAIAELGLVFMLIIRKKKKG